MSMKKGSTGADVQAIQSRLKELGFLTGSVDGIFGSNTEKAVKRFQKSAGLEVDGIVGPATRAALGIKQSDDGEHVHGRAKTMDWRTSDIQKIFAVGVVATITDTIDAAAARLRGDTTHIVQIEHMDALRLIERYDNPDVLMYLDPPYLRSSRKSGALYAIEMDMVGQKQLLSLITQSRAKIIISGYENDLYNDTLAGWNKDSTMSQTTSTKMAMETIWMNYPQPMRQISFFEEENDYANTHL